MSRLHDLIYRLEEGGGKRWLRIAAAASALLLVAISYNWLCFRNMATQEAMDNAQLGRNIAEGNGFTTLFVRPFSMRLLQNRTRNNPPLNAPWESADPARLKGMHPDIANAPVYPLLLAGLMKVLPFHYRVDLTHRFWSTSSSRPVGDWEQSAQSRAFRRYQPDFVISAFNQIVLLVVALMTFFLARRLFDLRTAVLSTVLLLGTDWLWRFAVSGLATLVLLLIFSCLVWCLVGLEEKAGEPHEEPAADERAPQAEGVSPQGPNQAAPISRSKEAAALISAAFAGALVALGGLTRYPFGWLIVPVVFFIALFTGRRRLSLSLTTFLAFAVVFSPWIVRNYSLSGTPFGTASYAILEGTRLFPGHDLQRSLDPDLDLPGLVFVKLGWSKLLSNSGQIVQSDLPRLGGTWVGSFFLVGVLVPAAERRARRLGCFLGISVVVLAIAQALSRTQLSADSPDVNSENLLVLLVPAVWMYGTTFLYRLLGQMDWSFSQLQSIVVGVFAIITCLPMILSLLAFSRSPVVFPPYYPPSIQAATGFVKGDELMMSDVPWAAAWYGHAQCVWLTQTKRDLLAINDQQKPLQALYLTHATGAGQFESFDQWIRAGEENWGDFIMGCILQKQQGKPGPPPDFPLEFWQKGWPMHFLLTRRERPLTNSESR
jgi:4-amino-4-deoxy-L-arabinose transferase-like glycosyltransferase